jgi:hypothetical protein
MIKMRHILSFGDYRVGVDHDGVAKVFHRPMGFRFTCKRFKQSVFSLSLLSNGKLMIVAHGDNNNNPSELIIIDCGLDSPVDSNRLYFCKTLQKQEIQRGIGLKDICRVIFSMYTFDQSGPKLSIM